MSSVIDGVRIFVSASLSTGRFVGPVILIAVASHLDWLLAVYCVFGLIVALLVWRFSRKATAQSSERMSKSDQKSETQTVSSSELTKQLRLFFAIAMTVTMFVGYLQFVLGSLYLDWLSQPDQATRNMSITMTVVAVTALVCQLFVVKRLNWQSPKVLVLLGAILIAAVAGLTQVSSVNGVIMLMVPTALAIALMTPVYSRFAMSLSNSSKGKISGKLAVAHTAGYPLGSLMAGVLYSEPEHWWWPLLVLSVVVTMLCVWAVIRANKLNKTVATV